MNYQKQLIAKSLVFKITLSLFIMTSNAYAFEYQDYEKKIKSNYNIQNAIEKFPRRELEDVLRKFVASGRPNRLPGSSGHKNTRDYLEKVLKGFNNAGATFSKQEFSGTTEDKKDFTGVNFIWEKKGTTSPSEILYLSAFYDTLVRDPKTGKAVLKGEMPGADNNGSGVSVLLSMIEILNKLDLQKSVKIVFFDLEESGAQGSKALVKSSEFQNDKSKNKINGLMNIVMVGHDTRTGDLEKKSNNMKLYTRPHESAGYANDEALAKMLMGPGSKNYNTVTFTLSEEKKDIHEFPQTLNPFWEANIPAVSFSQNREGDLNPRFMTSNDFVETLNINTYLNVFKYVTSAVLAWNYDVVK
jgi:Zn-dependent M28 family amino/carboxypeptidase